MARSPRLVLDLTQVAAARSSTVARRRRKTGGAATGKNDFPLSQVRRHLGHGPIVLVTSRYGGKTNIMTMGWHTVMEFTPALIGCVISA